MTPTKNLASMLRTQIRRLRFTNWRISMRQRLGIRPDPKLDQNQSEAKQRIAELETILDQRPGGMLVILAARSNPWWG